jgi:acid phosphatase
MENKSVDDVMGSAPYLQHLARIGASFTDWHAVAHPSQPNYIAMFSGSTHGVTTDDCPQRLSGPNLGRALIDAGRTFAGYSEGMPRTGYTGCGAGRYARKHNPWVDFGDVPASANRTFAAFPSDFSRLPTVSFVIPDLCDDTHNCDVRTGDTWLREHLDGYARWALTHDSVLVVTWDENDGSAGNRIPTVLVGQRVRPGTYGARATHYTLLRTIEDMYGLPPLGASAATGPITGVWRT